MNAGHGPHIGEIAARELATPLAGKHDLFVAPAEVVAHPDLHLVPHHNAFDVEELTNQRTEREHREAVKHDVDVPVLTKHAAALGEEDPVGLRVVGELLEPPCIVRLAVMADDPSVPEPHVLVHPGVRGVGDDDVHRCVWQRTEKLDAVLRANVVAAECRIGCRRGQCRRAGDHLANGRSHMRSTVPAQRRPTLPVA